MLTRMLHFDAKVSDVEASSCHLVLYQTARAGGQDVTFKLDQRASVLALPLTLAV